MMAAPSDLVEVEHTLRQVLNSRGALDRSGPAAANRARPGYAGSGVETPIPPRVSAPYRAISSARSSGRSFIAAPASIVWSRSAGTSQHTSNSMPSGSLA